MSNRKKADNQARVWTCRICSSSFRTRSLLSSHKKENHSKEELKQFYSTAGKPGLYYCIYCNKISKTKTGITLHERYCFENPQKLDYVGHAVTEETRAKISKKQSENCKNRIGWNGVIGRSKQSYAETYFDTVLTAKNIPFQKNYHVDKYWLDYAFPDKHIYFEVDGEQHYTEAGISHDQERTETLAQLGWYCVARIRWSLFSKLEFTDKEHLVSSLLDSINSLQPIELSYPIKPKDKSLDTKDTLIQNGQVNIRGIPVKTMLSNEEWDRRKQLILNLAIDRNKYGWKAIAIQQTGLTKRQIENTLKHFPEIFSK